ncbi:MAG TPA: methionine ABC transporter ATP-binding protein [Erysipelotrichaceae bacterium]|jgi:D-methionine transport system ATP-binding protein|nr:methionine ABC transporter ATP-binding protein [Erysipelotrichaceae bacterium]
MIELKNIVKTFNTKNLNIHAVNDVSVTIEDGEIFGIVGYSGAGKSTLVRIINQLEKQTSGTLIINGEDISKLSNNQLRKKRQKIGMIFQHFNLLWSRTVFRNIELPLEIAGVDKETREKRVVELIKLVGLDGREDSYPSELSGGQKQRVGIARALANDPNILLCDEATSALDPETTESILDLLSKINDELGITIVLITHQMEVVQRICQRVAIMSDGYIVELGSVKDVFARPKHEVTKRFVQNIDSGKNIDRLQKDLKALYPNGEIMRLTFMGGNSDKPIIAGAIKKTGLLVSILDSNINHTKLGVMGFTYLHIPNGDESKTNEFISYLVENDVKVEVV